MGSNALTQTGIRSRPHIVVQQFSSTFPPASGVGLKHKNNTLEDIWQGLLWR
jgi:hypothetical protein